MKYSSMEREKLLIAIIENAIDGIITIDDRGLIENINPAALELFGYPTRGRTARKECFCFNAGTR